MAAIAAFFEESTARNRSGESLFNLLFGTSHENLKNRLNNSIQHAEPRIMLASSDSASNDYISNPPSGLDVENVTDEGTIELVVAGNLTYAVVPSQISEFAELDDDSFNNAFIEAAIEASNAATDPDSDQGTTGTFEEEEQINQRIARVLADRVNGAVYVGETDSGILSRINSELLPALQTEGTTKDLLGLGFKNPFGDAENSEELPDRVTINDNVIRSLNRVRNRSRRFGIEVGTLLNRDGRVDRETGLVDGEEDFVPLGNPMEFRSIDRPAGIIVHSHPSFEATPNGSRGDLKFI